jgi:hypothetical protein
MARRLMLSLQLDTEPLERDIDNMLMQLTQLPSEMADQLTAWQREDMKRTFPNTVMPDAQTVETDIWPRSRTPSKHLQTGHPRGRPIGRRLASAPIGRRPLQGKPAPSTRPILRESLFDMLDARMRALLDAIRWK